MWTARIAPNTYRAQTNDAFLILRPAILELFGINYWSYPDEARAVALADEKIEKNRQDYPWILEKNQKPEFADVISKADPLAGSEFFFVHYGGTSKTQQVDMEQTYSMEGDVSKKPVGDVIDSFLEDEPR
jgi:hypothetical protein